MNLSKRKIGKMLLRTSYSYCRTLIRTVCYKKSIILGIETSCDDTGCAIVDSDGNILGEALNSQHTIHLNNGGIIPPLAQNLHRDSIERVMDKAVQAANICLNDVDAIATTVKPGLSLSLLIGMKYGKHLCRLHNKPMIPIHHMEAHALTARMIDPSVQYPFVVLLISGGHCLLAVVQSVDKFLLLGQSLDDAPGEAFDKTARRLKLKNIPEFSKLSGGQAIELAASKATDMLEFPFTVPLSGYRDCNFSMAGLKTKALRHIQRQEKAHNVEADGIIPGAFNLCAGFQLAVTRHLCHRTQRALEYAETHHLIPNGPKTLVVSGGAACNHFIFQGLQIVSDSMGYRAIRPPPKLCTDNGAMIAWNGIERWTTNRGIVSVSDLNMVDMDAKAPLGINMIEDVTNANIKCKWTRITSLYQNNASNNKEMNVSN